MLNVADPANFLASKSVLGSYLLVRTACFQYMSKTTQCCINTVLVVVTFAVDSLSALLLPESCHKLVHAFH